MSGQSVEPVPPEVRGKNCAYLLRCADGSLYAGWTNDLEKRLRSHRAGRGAKYTRSRLPVELAWYAVCGDKREAMRLEYALKHLTRGQKLALLKGEYRL